MSETLKTVKLKERTQQRLKMLAALQNTTIISVAEVLVDAAYEKAMPNKEAKKK